MSLPAIQDYLLELRDTNSVLESYAQLATRCQEHDPTSIQQVGAFMFMVYQQQRSILDKLEATIKQPH